MTTIRILLTITFGWALQKSIKLLVRHESLDRILFDAVHLKWLFYFLLFGLVTSQAVSLVWFLKPFPHGYLFSFSAVLINLIETSFACAIAAGNTEIAKRAFSASRESRGLSARPEILEMMDRPIVHFAPLAVSVIFAIVWCVLTVVLMRSNN
ncbi:MAG: hypothetical protein O3C60_17235 [Planctomycetota bacterium]|nr:hypothetical protein [Planctomycetota bacterium]